MEKSRLEAFSDGVFAIVITLLILDIRFPEVDYSQFATALATLLPRILMYVLSFIIIGLYWISHHNSMQVVKKIDRNFLWLNILLLLCVSFIPFPTSLVGRYPFQAWPIIIYGSTLIVCNLIGTAMMFYLIRHPDLAVPQFGTKYVRRHTPIHIAINGSYLCAILLAHPFPVLSYLIYVAVVIGLIILLPRVDDGINIK
jgi:uncharacterized membrane protein